MVDRCELNVAQRGEYGAIRCIDRHVGVNDGARAGANADVAKAARRRRIVQAERANADRKIHAITGCIRHRSGRHLQAAVEQNGMYAIAVGFLGRRVETYLAQRLRRTASKAADGAEAAAEIEPKRRKPSVKLIQRHLDRTDLLRFAQARKRRGGILKGNPTGQMERPNPITS